MKMKPPDSPPAAEDSALSEGAGDSLVRDRSRITIPHIVMEYQARISEEGTPETTGDDREPPAPMDDYIEVPEDIVEIFVNAVKRKFSELAIDAEETGADKDFDAFHEKRHDVQAIVNYATALVLKEKSLRDIFRLAQNLRREKNARDITEDNDRVLLNLFLKSAPAKLREALNDLPVPLEEYGERALLYDFDTKIQKATQGVFCLRLAASMSTNNEEALRGREGIKNELFRQTEFELGHSVQREHLLDEEMEYLLKLLQPFVDGEDRATTDTLLGFLCDQFPEEQNRGLYAGFFATNGHQLNASDFHQHGGRALGIAEDTQSPDLARRIVDLAIHHPPNILLRALDLLHRLGGRDQIVRILQEELRCGYYGAQTGVAGPRSLGALSDENFHDRVAEKWIVFQFVLMRFDDFADYPDVLFLVARYATDKNKIETAINRLIEKRDFERLRELRRYTNGEARSVIDRALGGTRRRA